MQYLNLGCGGHFHPDWTNVDFTSTGEGVIAHNLRQGLPFADRSFDVVYHSHVLEHFPKAEAAFFLRECFRVLRPEGVLRVVVPDLEAIAQLYLTALEKASQGSAEWAAHYDWMLLELYDQTVRTHSGGEMAAYLAQDSIPNEDFVISRLGLEAENLIATLRQQRSQPAPASVPLSEQELELQHLLGDDAYQALTIGRFRQSGEVHQWMYDRYSLTRLLTTVGFQQVEVCQAHESRIPDFAQYGLDVMPDGKVRKPDSLFVEALKASDQDVAFQQTSEVQKKQPPAQLRSPQPSHTQLDQLKAQLRQTRAELKQAQSIISAMESSKFWKLRSLWLKLKRSLRLTQDN